MSCNLQGIADILGVSKPTVNSWVGDGLPFTKRGAKGVEWEFSPPDVVRWYAERHAARAIEKHEAKNPPRRSAKDDPFVAPGEGGETIEEAELRHKSALADKHEMAAAKEAGTLVPIDEVAAIVMQEYASAKVRILGIPNSLRPLLLTHLNNDRAAAEKCVSRVEETIYEALSEIVSYVGQALPDDA